MASSIQLLKLLIGIVLSIFLATAFGQETSNELGSALNKMFSGLTTKKNTSTSKATESVDNPSKWNATDAITVEQAQARFAKFFPIPMGAGDRVLEAPFEGWYFLMKGGALGSVFNADITILGVYNIWHTRKDNKLLALDEAQVRAVMAELRQHVRPDAVIPAWQNKSQAQGVPINIVFTAPNCPACLQLDGNLTRLGTAITANVVFVPQILSQNERIQRSFSESIMCAPDPQAAFSATFVEKGRGRYAPPQGCTKGLWPDLMAMAFYPGYSSAVSFQSGVSIPAVFSAGGKRITSVQWTGPLTAKDANAALNSTVPKN